MTGRPVDVVRILARVDLGVQVCGDEGAQHLRRKQNVSFVEFSMTDADELARTIHGRCNAFKGN